MNEPKYPESPSILRYFGQLATASSANTNTVLESPSILRYSTPYYTRTRTHALTTRGKSRDTRYTYIDISSTITKLKCEGKVVVSKWQVAEAIAQRILVEPDLSQYSAIRIGKSEWLFGKAAELYPPPAKHQQLPKILEQEMAGFVELFVSNEWYGVLDARAYSAFGAYLLLTYEIGRRGYDPLKLQYEQQEDQVVFWYDDDGKLMRMRKWQNRERSPMLK